jgi:hypothetical protein
MTVANPPKTKLFFVLALITCIWAYHPGLGGTFIFDDVWNISNNNELKINQLSTDQLIQASLSGYSGPLKRPVSMLSFAINHRFTGMDPWWMKLTNLVIHIVNSLILLLLCKELFRSIPREKYPYLQTAPYIIAGIWLVHPINVTAVSYIVQRMTSLSSTFVLLAIYCYLKIRNSRLDNWKSYLLALSIMICWGLGMLSKEIAITLSIYLFAIEWCIYGFQSNSSNERIRLNFLWAILAAPWIFALLYSIYDPPRLLSGYGSREFTLEERVLTEFRIVIDYLITIITPNIQEMGIYHDNIILSKSIFSPITTLSSFTLIIGLLISAIYAKQKHPLYSLGILWFFGGHILESTVFPIELKYLHRNYLPSIGVFIALAGLAVSLKKFNKYLVPATILAIFIAYSASTRALTYQWSGDYRMMVIEAINNPDSIRANFRAGQIYKYYAFSTKDSLLRTTYRDKAIEYFRTIEQLDSLTITGEMAILETYLLLKEQPPGPHIEKLTKILRTGKLNQGVVNIFKAIKKCMITEDCPLSEAEYYRVLDALLNNKNISRNYKRPFMITHAEYLSEAKGDFDAAIATILDLINVYPALGDLRLLSDYYEKGGYMENAKRAIDHLEQQDKYGQFSDYIEKSREKISN